MDESSSRGQVTQRTSFCRCGMNCRTLCSRELQPAFAFGTLCSTSGAKRELKPATTLLIPNTDRIREKFGLEQDLQCKLNQPGVGGGTGDNPERRGGVSRDTWICELCVIEYVEELRPELHRLFLMNARDFRERDIPIILAGAEKDADAGTAEGGCDSVVADNRRIAE